MRSSDLWKLRPSDPAIVKKWCRRLLVCGVSLGLLALAAGMATGDRSHRDGPAAVTGMAGAYSGAGNLVPVY
jgi:hypothetical protein